MSSVIELPTLGTRCTFRGQLYELTGTFRRERKDGSMATIGEWKSQCAECGEVFTFTAPLAAAKFQPNRRCQKHKRPGVRVRGVPNG